MGLRWVEMKQRDTSRYQELVLWIQEGWERCGFILSHFSSSNFADRLCFRQKIYYWKFFKIQNKISQLLSLHMSVSEQYSFFFFFLAKFTDTIIVLGPENMCQFGLERECTDFTHQKKISKQTGSTTSFTCIRFAQIHLRCSLLQPQIYIRKYPRKTSGLFLLWAVVFRPLKDLQFRLFIYHISKLS